MQFVLKREKERPPTNGLEVEGHQLAAGVPEELGVVVGGVHPGALGVDPAQLHLVVPGRKRVKDPHTPQALLDELSTRQRTLPLLEYQDAMGLQKWRLQLLPLLVLNL